MAGEVGGIAGIAVAVACGKDEDGLVADARLRQRGNRVAEVVAKLLLAVLLDDPGEAHAHVDEVDGAARPADDAVDEGRPPAVVVTEGRQRDRNIVAAAASGCDGEHRDVGAPGDAAPGAGCGSVRIARPPHDHRRDVCTVGGRVAGGIPVAGNDLLGHGLACKDRVVRVDPAVDQADGLAGARRPRVIQVHLETRPGAVGPDRRQPPLVTEGALVPELPRPERQGRRRCRRLGSGVSASATTAASAARNLCYGRRQQHEHSEHAHRLTRQIRRGDRSCARRPRRIGQNEPLTVHMSSIREIWEHIDHIDMPTSHIRM